MTLNKFQLQRRIKSLVLKMFLVQQVFLQYKVLGVNLVSEVYNIDKVIMHEENLGYSETWRRAWADYIPKDTENLIKEAEKSLATRLPT